ELRRRLIRSFIFIFIAATGAWFVSGAIYSFLAAPVERALAEAQRRQVPIAGQTGHELIGPLTSLKENDSGRYVFPEATERGSCLVPRGGLGDGARQKSGRRQAGVFYGRAAHRRKQSHSKGRASDRRSRFGD